jgi:hypothetical protein
LRCAELLIGGQLSPVATVFAIPSIARGVRFSVETPRRPA